LIWTKNKKTSTILQNQIKQFIDYLDIERNYSKNTQKSYARDLSKLHIFAKSKSINSWDELTVDDVNLFVMGLRHSSISSRSIRRHLSAVRGFLTYLLNHNLITKNCAVGIKTPKLDATLPDTLNYENILQLLKLKSNSWIELRDVAIIEVIYSCGLRVSEAVGLNVDDLDLNQGFVKVLGKGNKMRHVPLGESAKNVLDKYLVKHNARALFVNKNTSRISVRSVQNIVKKRAQSVGIEINVYPHMLRHAAATHFLQSSHDLRSTQEFLGHKSIKSTQVYTHLDFLELSKVYDKCHPRAKK